VFSRLLTAIGLAVLLAAVPLAHAQIVPVQPAPEQGISVVGSGIVTATPNVARITLGVEVSDASLANAQAEAARRMDAVVAQLKANGISDNDIHTVSYNVTPQYDNPQGGNTPTLRGYQVQNLVDVRSTNVGGLGQLLDTTVSAGATRIFGIRFEADDMEGLKSQARDQAMQNARAKAEQLARDAGVSLGRPIVVAENDTGGVNPVQAQPAARAAVGAAPTTPIEPGELQVQTTVRVVWAIQ
jgi:uncharacterized protein YggE